MTTSVGFPPPLAPFWSAFSLDVSHLAVLVAMSIDKRFDLFRVAVGILRRSQDGDSVGAGRAADVAPSVPVVILLHDKAAVFGLAQNRGNGRLRVPAPAHHVATLQHCCIIA